MNIPTTLVVLATGLTLAPLAQAQRQLNNYDMINLASDGGSSRSRSYIPHPSAPITYQIGSLPAETYLDASWQAGQLLTSSGQTPAVSKLRYNLQYHALEVEDASVAGGIRLQPVGSVQGFTLAGAGDRASRQFVSAPFYSRRTGANRDFLEILNPQGAIQLLALYQVTERPAQFNAILNTEIRPASWHRSTYLFARRQGQLEPAQELVLERKSLQRLFGDKAAQLDEYAQQQRLDYRKLDDVLKLVEEYNRLFPATTK